MRIGKFGENKINFRDHPTGLRGIQWPWQDPTRPANTYYRLCWFGRVPIPARGTATNFGGTARYGMTRGGQGAVVGQRVGTYAQSTYAHGIATIGGHLIWVQNSQAKGGGRGPTAPSSYIRSSLVAASIIRVSCNGYTAATVWLNLLVWGATTEAY
ncbi:MAG: hypothetical protein ACE5L6_02180 [Candidatus Bathyarchaeia archaeon]